MTERHAYAARLGTNDMGTRTLVFTIAADENPMVVANTIATDEDTPLLDWGLVADYIGGDLYELVTL